MMASCEASRASCEATIDGGLLIDKEPGWTSHDVVARLRTLARQRQIGHTGTLDPLASGLMVCLLGGATRIARYLTGLNKVYECDAQLGVETDTYDSEGRITARSDRIPDSREAVEAALRSFVGQIDQTPPIYSAIKIGGKRLYRYARANEQVEIPSRRVTIHRIELLEFAPPSLRFAAAVSAGAYVRSLCHDLGRRLGCGAMMTALRRTAVGPFLLGDAAKLAELEAAPDALEKRLLDIPRLLPFLSHLQADEEGRLRLAHGASCPPRHFAPAPGPASIGRPALALDERGKAIAMVTIEKTGSEPAGAQNEPSADVVVRPLRVFPVKP